MKKSSQIQPAGAPAFPERVNVAMAEIAGNMQDRSFAEIARHAKTRELIAG